jgi:hypothetical protein
VHITQERAQEILRFGSQYSNYSKQMTEQEVAEIIALWKTMPGYTCFYDAVVRVAQGRAA